MSRNKRIGGAFPNIKSRKDKLILSLYREWKNLSDELRELPLVELEQPMRRCFERRFVLTKAACNRKDSDLLEEALKYVDNYQVCRKGYFNKELCCKSSRRNRRNVTTHKLSRLRINDFFRLSVPCNLYPYFKTKRGVPIDNEYTLSFLRGKSYGGKFYFRYPKLTESKTQPYFITHVRDVSPRLESRIKEIETYLECNGGYARLANLRGEKYSWYFYSEIRFKTKIENIKFKEQLEDYDMENEKGVKCFTPFFVIRSMKTKNSSQLRADLYKSKSTCIKLIHSNEDDIIREFYVSFTKAKVCSHVF